MSWETQPWVKTAHITVVPYTDSNFTQSKGFKLIFIFGHIKVMIIIKGQFVSKSIDTSIFSKLFNINTYLLYIWWLLLKIN